MMRKTLRYVTVFHAIWISDLRLDRTNPLQNEGIRTTLRLLQGGAARERETPYCWLLRSPRPHVLLIGKEGSDDQLPRANPSCWW